MIIRGQLHDNSCKKKWFEQLCALCVQPFPQELKNLQTHKPKNSRTMKPETKSKWDTIIKLAIAILSAIAGALGATACC